MPPESQIPIASQETSRRFATRLALFYGAIFGLLGTYLPFFPVWLKAVGIEASWIGIITAVPAVTRFTVLPFVTALAERRQLLRNAIIITAFATALGLAVVGTQHQALLVFLAFAADLLPVDANRALDGCLCLAGCGALRPELRAVAALGLGRLRRGSIGVRATGRCDRAKTPDLGHRRDGRAERLCQSRSAAA